MQSRIKKNIGFIVLALLIVFGGVHIANADVYQTCSGTSSFSGTTAQTGTLIGTAFNNTGSFSGTSGNPQNCISYQYSPIVPYVSFDGSDGFINIISPSGSTPFTGSLFDSSFNDVYDSGSTNGVQFTSASGAGSYTVSDGGYTFIYTYDGESTFHQIPFYVNQHHIYLNAGYSEQNPPVIPETQISVVSSGGDYIISSTDGSPIQYLVGFGRDTQNAFFNTYVGGGSYTVAPSGESGDLFVSSSDDITSGGCDTYANCLINISADGGHYSLASFYPSSASASTTLVTSPDVQFIGYVVIFFLALMFAGFFMNNLKRKR